MKHSIRRRTGVCPVPKPRRRNVSPAVETEKSEKVIVIDVGVSLRDQVLRRVLRQNHQLHVLVVGAAGLGKTALIRSLLKVSSGWSTERQTGPVSVDCDVISGNISVRLRLTEAPGYGDAADNQEVFDQIENLVTAGLDNYFDYSLSASRQPDTSQDDNICDVCIFLLTHTGHGVREPQFK